MRNLAQFCISQGSVATSLRCGKYYVGFVVKLILFPVVKEFLKLVKIWQSCRQCLAANFRGAVLFGPLFASVSQQHWRRQLWGTGARYPPAAWPSCHVFQFGIFCLHISLFPVLGSEQHAFSRFSHRFTDSQSGNRQLFRNWAARQTTT